MIALLPETILDLVQGRHANEASLGQLLNVQLLGHENRHSEKVLLFWKRLDIKKHSTHQFIFRYNP
jgi:hypothetical protein